MAGFVRLLHNFGFVNLVADFLMCRSYPQVAQGDRREIGSAALQFAYRSTDFRVQLLCDQRIGGGSVGTNSEVCEPPSVNR